MSRKENCGWVLYFPEPLAGHREHTQFIDRTKSILDRPNHPVPAATVAFEIQYRVHHVFQHLGPRQGAFLGDMAHQDDTTPVLFCPTHQAGCRFSDLGNRTRSRCQGF